VEALLGQVAEERLVRPGVVGEAVEAQRQRSARRPLLEVGEVDPVGGDAGIFYGADPTAALVV